MQMRSRQRWLTVRRNPVCEIDWTAYSEALEYVSQYYYVYHLAWQAPFQCTWRTITYKLPFGVYTATTVSRYTCDTAIRRNRYSTYVRIVVRRTCFATLTHTISACVGIPNNTNNNSYNNIVNYDGSLTRKTSVVTITSTTINIILKRQPCDNRTYITDENPIGIL